MKKMMSAAQKLNVLFKVLQRITVICMIVVLCVMAVLTVVHMVNPDAVIGENMNMVDLGPVTLELAEEFTPANRSILVYAWVYTVLSLICAAMIWKALGVIRKILQPMTEGRPFDENTAGLLKNLSVISLVLGAAANLGGILETAAAIRSFGLNQIMESGMIRSVTANYSVDLTFVVVFFILLLMSYIFSYGAQLQQLSDETL